MVTIYDKLFKVPKSLLCAVVQKKKPKSCCVCATSHDTSPLSPSQTTARYKQGGWGLDEGGRKESSFATTVIQSDPNTE